MNDPVIIRKARREDCQAIINLSKEIADYHKDFNSPQIDVKVLEKDAFDNKQPFIGFYVAASENEIIGYAHYFFSYSVRHGKEMWLQDLYVKEKFRNKKIGDKLMRQVAIKASEENCKVLELKVADWNPAVNFYKKRGAINLTETNSFHLLSFDEEAIKKMTK